MDFEENEPKTEVMSISGLRLISGFLPPSVQGRLVSGVIALDRSIQAGASKKGEVATHISRQHNLATQEVYRKIILEDQGKIFHAQHFDRYGEEGHQLTYFIGESNIPSCIKNEIISRIEALEDVQALKPKFCDSWLDWRCTLNTYRFSSVNTRALSGFGWHKDMSPNGDFTAICSLLSAGNIQMRSCENHANMSSYILLPGSCLVLSDKARWDYEHCVLPQEIRGITQEDIKRISLVYGGRWINSKR